MASHTAQLGTAPIGKLFVSLSMPVILSLLVGGLYNLVDTLFIARGVDALAVGGVAIVFPIQMIIIAIGGTIGNGLASVVTRHIGAGDMDRAQAVTGNAVLLSLLVGVVVMTIVLLTMQPLLRGLGVTEQLWPYAQDYLVVSIWGTPVVLLLSCLNNLARAEGKMHYLTYSILLSSLLNIVLDPIAIYLLHWGVMGVAWATVIAQLVTTLFMLWLFLSNRTQLKISLATLRLNSVITGQIVALGMPTFFSNIGVSVIIGLVNALLGHSGLAEADHLISAYGIVSRIFMFLFFPLLGMMISYQTICGFNYGAAHYGRVREASTLSVRVATLYCAGTALLMLLFPDIIIRLFSDDNALLREAVPITRFVFSGFLVTGAPFIWAAYFQAIGRAKPALFLSSFRIYLVQVPLLLMAPAIFGVEAIWYSYPITSCVSLVVSWLFIRHAYRDLDAAQAKASLQVQVA